MLGELSGEAIAAVRVEGDRSFLMGCMGWRESIKAVYIHFPDYSMNMSRETDKPGAYMSHVDVYETTTHTTLLLNTQRLVIAGILPPTSAVHD